MLEKFKSNNIGDFSHRYAGTYGMFCRGGAKRLVYVDRVDNSARTVRFVDAGGAKFTLEADAIDDAGFDMVPSTKAWHQTSDGAYLIARVPARQYQRGICNSNTRITDENSKAKSINFGNLSKVFAEGKPSFRSAMDNRSCAAAVLGEHFMFKKAGDPTSVPPKPPTPEPTAENIRAARDMGWHIDRYMEALHGSESMWRKAAGPVFTKFLTTGDVFMLDKAIGNFTHNEEGIVISLALPMFKVEMTDALRRNGIKGTVK